MPKKYDWECAPLQARTHTAWPAYSVLQRYWDPDSIQNKVRLGIFTSSNKPRFGAGGFFFPSEKQIATSFHETTFEKPVTSRRAAWYSRSASWTSPSPCANQASSHRIAPLTFARSDARASVPPMCASSEWLPPFRRSIPLFNMGLLKVVRPTLPNGFWDDFSRSPGQTLECIDPILEVGRATEATIRSRHTNKILIFCLCGSLLTLFWTPLKNKTDRSTDTDLNCGQLHVPFVCLGFEERWPGTGWQCLLVLWQGSTQGSDWWFRAIDCLNRAALACNLRFFDTRGHHVVLKVPRIFGDGIYCKFGRQGCTAAAHIYARPLSKNITAMQPWPQQLRGSETKNKARKSRW